MNPIRLLRAQKNVTQGELAKHAGTSQPTIAMYESGEKSPTLSTLEKLAEAMGLRAIVTFAPPLTREDERSLAYHEAIVKRLKEDPAQAIMAARKNLEMMRKRQLYAGKLFNRWDEWLRLPTDELICNLLDPGLLGRDMRQVSPFAGILSARERLKIINTFRKRYRP